MNNNDFVHISSFEELKSNGASVVKGYWGVGQDNTGASFNIPFTVLNGAKEGPTLWIQGCIDGDEPSAAWTVISLIQSINVDELCGRLILIPVLNVESFRARTQVSPIDGLKLRNSSPGDPQGNHTEQLAYHINQEIKTSADYLIDIHSGTSIMFVTEFTCFYEGLKVSKEAQELALATCSPTIVRAKLHSEYDRTMMFTHACENGIPAIMITNGGHRRVEPQFFEPLVTQCENVMRYLKMLPGDVSPVDESELLSGIYFSRSTRGGFVFYEVKYGDWLIKDQVIARIYDVFGNQVETICCPYEKALILETASGTLNSGDLVAEYFVPMNGNNH